MPRLTVSVKISPVTLAISKGEPFRIKHDLGPDTKKNIETITGAAVFCPRLPDKSTVHQSSGIDRNFAEAPKALWMEQGYRLLSHQGLAELHEEFPPSCVWTFARR